MSNENYMHIEGEVDGIVYKFNEGDKVICIRSSIVLDVGGIYIIERRGISIDKITIVTVREKPLWWCESRFEKLLDPVSKKFNVGLRKLIF